MLTRTPARANLTKCFRLRMPVNQGSEAKDRAFVPATRRVAMRSKLLVKSIPLVIAMFAPLIAQAQTKPPAAGADALLQQWDTDHDGTLTVDEVKKAADARFDALDRDHDDTLDGKELRGILSAKELAQADGDKDKTLDKTEYEAVAAQRFQAADPDHDGTLDKKELNSRAGKALLRMLQ
jgi:Ca2+-binding EF-hand superfamily protein